MIRTAVLALALITLTSFPSPPSSHVGRHVGSIMTPTVACAAGSPDETLTPHASPAPRIEAMNRSDLRLTAIQRWRIWLGVFRTFAIRV